ncbi:MAG TPA: NHL repeat-containing protein [Candidatus Acidoferrales bacterium]|nr:NHL repeat-containing protein [Candidatus Acidoferrales bacterium]
MPPRPTLGCMALAVLTVTTWFAGCWRVQTQAQSETARQASVSYIGAWGAKGDGPGQLSGPVDIATDSVGDAYIVNAESHFIEKFDRRGTPLLAFEEDGLRHPQAITVDSGGAIYVTDSQRGGATVFLPSGDRYREIRVRTHPSLEDVLGIAVEDDGTVHILDPNAGKVFTYSSRFSLLRAWVPTADGPSIKVRPKAVANGFDGFLYVADPEANRILRFTSDGRFFAALNAGADGSNRRLGDRIAVGRGYVFAMDIDGRMLHVFSTDGRPVLDADLASELGQAKRLPPALAVSPQKELLVLDAPAARVLRYRLNF